MKRLLLLIAVLFALCFSLYAQQTDGVVLDAKGRVVPQKKMKSNYSKDAKFAFKAEGEYKKHELGIYYGWASPFPIVGISAEILSLSLYKGDTRFSGTANLEYLYHIHRAVGLGISLTYEYGKNPKKADFHSHHHYITAMPTVKIYWIVHNNYALYSRFAVGATYITGKYNDTQENRWMCALQATTGFEAGNQTVRGFFEGGIGMQGLILVGIRTKF